MSAVVIAFPTRRPSQRNPYGFLEAESMLRWRAKPEATFHDALVEYAAARTREAFGNLPAGEDEILKLLRRIDRRLSKLATEALPSADGRRQGAASASF